MERIGGDAMRAANDDTGRVVLLAEFDRATEEKRAKSIYARAQRSANIERFCAGLFFGAGFVCFVLLCYAIGGAYV